MMAQVEIGSYYLPGELIKNVKSKDKQTIIGPGLRRNEEDVNTLVATLAGKLYFRPPNTYWIESRRNRYIPKKGDLVVGIITKKSGDTLKVDIGSAESASLSMLAFEGATKKQKPDVTVGDLVYARVLNAHKEMEPELVCIDSFYKAGRLGVLSNDGFLISVKQALVQMLLNLENPLLRTLSKKFPYEIAVGVNGKVWMKANRIKDVLTLCRAFEAAESQDEKAVVNLCRQFILLRHLSKQHFSFRWLLSYGYIQSRQQYKHFETYRKMVIPEIEEVFSKYKSQEDKIETILKQKEEACRIKSKTSLLSDDNDSISLEHAKQRNKQLLKELEEVKGNLRSKAIFSPTELQWEKVCKQYKDSPALPVTTWHCHFPVFV